MSSDTNRADRGALFQLSNFGMRSLSAFRRRAATFPADEHIDEYGFPDHEYGFPDLLDLSSVCSHSSLEGREHDSSIDTNHRHYESPANPNASNENPMICFNNTYNGDTQLARVQSTVPSTNERLRLPIGQSPIGHNLQHLNEGSPVRPMHVNSSHWENTPNSSPMSSVFSNSNVSSPVSSIVTPMALYNGLHLPVRQVFNYGNLYPLYSGNNPFYERSNWPNNYYSHSDRVEEMAKSHRNAATHADARHTWSGSLPNNSTHKNPVYSCKVFLGGVPWEMNDHDIKMTFSRYNVVTVLRPGKDVRLSRASQDREKAGYLYLILESDKSVKSLLNACTHDFSNGGKFYYPLNQPRFRPKDVQVIPWNTYDSTYVKSPSARLDNNKTVFVGALHGMLTAEGLATILEDLFGGVVYVGIDTDKFKYPIGSGRVTFSTTKAYTKAVHAGFIDVKANRFTKKIQIDPFLEESNCSHCRINKGPFFCRDLCMRYLCRVCWDVLHSSEAMKRHQPLMRNRSSKH